MSVVDDYLSSEELSDTENLADELFPEKPKAKIKKKPGRPKTSAPEQKENHLEKQGIPEEVKRALDGYIDLLESDIMDLAEIIAEKTAKMEELRKKRDIVKAYMGEHDSDEE